MGASSAYPGRFWTGDFSGMTTNSSSSHLLEKLSRATRRSSPRAADICRTIAFTNLAKSKRVWGGVCGVVCCVRAGHAQQLGCSESGEPLPDGFRAPCLSATECVSESPDGDGWQLHRRLWSLDDDSRTLCCSAASTVLSEPRAFAAAELAHQSLIQVRCAFELGHSSWQSRYHVMGSVPSCSRRARLEVRKQTG